MTQVSCCQFVDPVASFHTCVTEPTCPINTFGHQGNQHPMQAHPNQQLQHQSTCMQQGTQLQHQSTYSAPHAGTLTCPKTAPGTLTCSNKHQSTNVHSTLPCPNSSSRAQPCIYLTPHAGTLTCPTRAPALEHINVLSSQCKQPHTQTRVLGKHIHPAHTFYDIMLQMTRYALNEKHNEYA